MSIVNPSNPTPTPPTVYLPGVHKPNSPVRKRTAARSAR